MHMHEIRKTWLCPVWSSGFGQPSIQVWNWLDNFTSVLAAKVYLSNNVFQIWLNEYFNSFIHLFALDNRVHRTKWRTTTQTWILPQVVRVATVNQQVALHVKVECCITDNSPVRRRLNWQLNTTALKLGTPKSNNIAALLLNSLYVDIHWHVGSACFVESLGDSRCFYMLHCFLCSQL